MPYLENMIAKETKKFNEVRDALEVIWSEGYPPHIAVFTGVNGDVDADLLSPPSISHPDGITVFNLGIDAIRTFSFDESKFTINFSTKIGGRDTHIIIPVRCIVAVLKDGAITLRPDEVWTTPKPYIPTGGVPAQQVPVREENVQGADTTKNGSAITTVAGNVIHADFGGRK